MNDRRNFNKLTFINNQEKKKSEKSQSHFQKKKTSNLEDDTYDKNNKSSGQSRLGKRKKTDEITEQDNIYQPRKKPRYNSPEENQLTPIPKRNCKENPLINIQPSSLHFRGPYKKNYENFYYRVTNMVNNTNHKLNFNELGNVDNKKKYYFVETDDIKNIAVELLTTFWSIENNEKLTQSEHWSKCENNGNNSPLFPSCISFILATIDNKKYCFIAISGIDKMSQEAYTALKSFLSSYKDQSEKIEYLLVEGDIHSLNVTTGKLTNRDKDIFKSCSEKFFIACLRKLFIEHGDKLRIEGVLNTNFYPYREGKKYGNQDKDSVDKTVMPPTGTDGERISKGFHITFKPCCPACQKNKPTILLILKTAQDIGIEQNQQNIVTKQSLSNNRLELSPLRNSITMSSFLLNNKKEEEVKKTTNKSFIPRICKMNGSKVKTQ